MNLNVLIIVVLFYVGWFGCVLVGKTSYPELTLVFPLLLVGFLLFKREINLRSFFIAAFISLLGVLFDSLMASSQLILIEGQTQWFVPLWLVSIWLLFSYSMFRLGPLLSLPMWLAALLGFFMGPLSYKSGEFFGVLAFQSLTTFVIYAIFWALIFPLVLILSKRFS